MATLYGPLDFAGAAGTLPANLTENDGNWECDGSGKLQETVAFGGRYLTYSGAIGNDQWLEVTWNPGSAYNPFFTALILRVGAAALTSVKFRYTTTSVEISNSAGTTLTNAAVSIPVSTDTVLRVEAEGDTARFYVDGSLACSTTDVSVSATSGPPGMYIEPNSTAPERWDDLSFGDFTTAFDPPAPRWDYRSPILRR